MNPHKGPPRPLVEYFEPKVDKNGPVPPHQPNLGPCWLWIACKSGGYGHINTEGKVRRAHVVSFFLSNGRWPTMKILHRCDNPTCVNPAHLFEGSQADNVADMISKGRDRKSTGDAHWTRQHPGRLAGAHHPQAKLTEDDVRMIRASSENPRVLGEKLGVSRACIAHIRRRLIWKHVP